MAQASTYPAGDVAASGNKLLGEDSSGAVKNFAQSALLVQAQSYPGINAQTGTAYTLALTDAGELVKTNNASANTITVPPNSSVSFQTNNRIDLLQYGAGQTSIVAGAGVTIRSSGSKLKLTGQYSAATLIKIATDEWVLVGDIAS